MMKCRLVLLMFCLSAGCFSAANAEDSFDTKTIGDLLTLCDMSIDDPWYGVSQAYCLGYISSAQDAQVIGKKGDPASCPDATVTRQQILDNFLVWANQHPEQMENPVPVSGLTLSASKKWPCQ
ncbi:MULTISPECIES: Rap1a/Tai family immunity protein [Corallincola]|uniref:Rap1a immunity protein domain-containing protein n=2 Tax=Corallincola TaxID=1775176 RepID=A0ABY1WLL3_9GAMM|nr:MULTISPECIES: Rap1a/Tai family immunity protein [Corallincola]TAA41717.1 hypothetical protein EXY25_15865 [Corallincola spongiicola]TCI01148.1 hypothetical protein EZV61_19115 [Corallincola luteus]